MKRLFILCTILSCLIIFLPLQLLSQKVNFTRQDTLRGSITPERAWWDLIYYHLDIRVNPADSTIKGTKTVIYRVIKPAGIMQIDLREPLVNTKALQNGNVLNFNREGNV